MAYHVRFLGMQRGSIASCTTATSQSQRMNTPSPSLYERIGGAEAVRSMVEQFYQRVLSDEQLAPHFRHAPMSKLQHMQTEFFSAALDGPSLYSGRPVRHAHGAQSDPLDPLVEQPRRRFVV